MISKRTAQTGKRVYRGTGQSPNRGQVSARGAQGYIKRELRNKNRAGVVRRIGGDGKSDNRSGQAAKAMQRKKRKAGPTKLPPKKMPPRGDTGPKGPGSQIHSLNPPTAPVQQVQVTADGTLQLPYDQTFGAEQLAAVSGANDELLGLKAEGDQQAMEYGQSKRQNELAYGSLKQQTLNQNAAQGTAFSSRYGTAVANNATGFANQQADLESANTSFKQNQGLQQQAIQNSLNHQLAALAQNYADSLNDQAGDLGYGRDESLLFQPNTGRIDAKKERRQKAAQAKLRKERAQNKRQRERKQDRKQKARVQERNKLRRQRQRKNKKGGKD